MVRWLVLGLALTGCDDDVDCYGRDFRIDGIDCETRYECCAEDDLTDCWYEAPDGRRWEDTPAGATGATCAVCPQLQCDDSRGRLD